MFRRLILSRIYQYQPSDNFCILGKGNSSLVNPKTAISPSKCEPVSSNKLQEKAHGISYLMNSCGFSRDKAISASGKVHSIWPDRATIVLKFLENHGFSQTQIAQLIERRPIFLLSNPEKSFLPKSEFLLKSTGIPEIDVLVAIVRHPAYLTRSLENHMTPVYYYLKNTIGSEKVDTLLRQGSWIFYHASENILKLNVDLLKILGMPQSSIEFLLFSFSDIITQKHENFKKIVAEVQEMGFNPLKSTFTLAMHARTGKSNKAIWARCYETYSKWGWSKDDIYMAFKKHPNCMLLSGKKISSFLDFVVNKLGRDSRVIARMPHTIRYSMEKRVIPRCSVLHSLSSKGLIKEDWSMGSVLSPNENNFLDKFVTKFKKELPELVDIYKGEQVVWKYD